MTDETGEFPHLRRLIADAIERSDDEPYDEAESVYLLNADAVLDALGLEQVGWWGPASGDHSNWTHLTLCERYPGTPPCERRYRRRVIAGPGIGEPVVREGAG